MKRGIWRRTVIVSMFIIGILAMSSSAFASNQGCSISPFSFDTGITPPRFQDTDNVLVVAGWCDFLQIASNIIGLLHYIVISIAILAVMAGGLLMLTSGGGEKQLKQGQGLVKSALIGVLIALSAGLLISFIMRGLGVTDTALFPWLI